MNTTTCPTCPMNLLPVKLLLAKGCHILLLDYNFTSLCFFHENSYFCTYLIYGNGMC